MKKKPRITKQKVKSGLHLRPTATLNGDPLEIITFIANGVIHICNALASVSTPVTSMPDTITFEDADFEIIEQKKINNE